MKKIRKYEITPPYSIKKTYTYTAYTDPEYQGVTDPLAYTDTYTDIMLKKTTQTTNTT